jgi:hypothetical protein
VSALHRPEVGGPLPLEYDRRRAAEPHQRQVERKAADAAGSVKERLNALELVVQMRELLRQGTFQELTAAKPVADSADNLRPLL